MIILALLILRIGAKKKELEEINQYFLKTWAPITDVIKKPKRVLNDKAFNILPNFEIIRVAEHELWIILIILYRYL